MPLGCDPFALVGAVDRGEIPKRRRRHAAAAVIGGEIPLGLGKVARPSKLADAFVGDHDVTSLQGQIKR